MKEKRSQTKTTRYKLEEKLENSPKLMPPALDDQTYLCDTGEQRVWEKEASVSEQQKLLDDEHQGSARVEEKLSQARTDRDEHDEKFESELLSTQTHQHDLRIQEKTITQQHRTREEKLDRKTTLEEERLRSSRIKLQEERQMSTMTKRKVQSEVSATQEALTTDLERENVVHKFMIKDRESEEEKTTVHEVRTKVNEELSRSSIYGREEGLGNELAETPRAITNKVCLGNTRKVELREKKAIEEELEKRLEEEQQRRIKVEEELRHQKTICTGLEETIQDLVEMCLTLQSENYAHRLQEQESRDNESIVGQLRETFGDGQYARIRLEEELSQTRIACTELKGRLDDHVQVCGRLETQSESFARNVREQEIAEKEIAITELQETLSKVDQAKVRLEEELSQARNSCTELERKLENELVLKHGALENEINLHMGEQRMSDMQEMVDQLKKNLDEEQQARIAVKEELTQARFAYTELERRMENERLSRQSNLREQRRICDQESQEKTTLEMKLRNLEFLMEEERNRYLSTERELRTVVSETQCRQPHDWVIQREEVDLYGNILGRGGWGIVCEGTFRGCQVAVKQIHELILSPHNRRLFEREMSIASSCHHPNLLLFVGATNDDGSPLFVTELLDTSLREVLCQRTLKEYEIVSLALDVAKGLSYLHLKKPLPIIHRDISSSNVLLWRRDERWRAKLSDFGAANFMRQYMTPNPGAMIYSAPDAHTPQQSPKVKEICFFISIYLSK